MANTLTTVIPQILAQGLVALRKEVVLPRLVNASYSNAAAEKGDTIDIPIGADVSATTVSPGNTPPSTSDFTTDKVQIKLDTWIEAAFYLSDKDIQEAMRGVVPLQVDRAIKAIAERVNTDILGVYKGVYGYAGAAATTPFGSNYTEATTARKILNLQMAPLSPRYVVLDPDAEEKAINLTSFADSAFASESGVIKEGVIGRKLGMDWFMDQQVPTHTAGTITTGLITKTSTAVLAGLKTFVATTAASTGACALLEGDVINIAGHSQTYVLTAAATQASAATDVTLAISPGLQYALVGSEAITVKASHVVNLVFHRDAIALATRPLADVYPGGSRITSASDSRSGLSLRLEVSREHKRTRWSFDILYGVKLVRPELACRLAG